MDPDDDPVTPQKADIINLSWGGPSSNDPSLLKIINDAYNSGILIVNSAGNANSNLDEYPSYPAVYENAMAIASTNPFEEKAKHSNYGSAIEVCAPGGSVYPTQHPEMIFSTSPMDPGYYMWPYLPENYGYLSGTSMAAPYVAGLAALLKSYDNSLSNEELRNIITGTADPCIKLNIRK